MTGNQAKLLYWIATALVVMTGMACDRPIGTKASTPKPDASPPFKEIKIGYAGPLSGRNSLGHEELEGARLAIESLNARKAKIGGSDVRFVLEVVNDDAEAKGGASIAQKLVDAKVMGVVGHLNAGVSVPASATYQKAGVPLLTTAVQLDGNVNEWTFRLKSNDRDLAKSMAEYVQRTEFQRIYLLHDKTAYGEQLATTISRALPRDRQRELDGIEDTPAGFKASIRKLKAAAPDAVVIAAMDEYVGRYLVEARRAGLNVLFIGGDGACTNELGKIAGKAAENFVCFHFGVPQEALEVEFKKAFTAKYGEVKQYSTFSYDGVLMLGEAMQRANSTEPSKFRPEMFNISFTGATGEVRFNKDGSRKAAPTTVFQVQGGKIVPREVFGSVDAMLDEKGNRIVTPLFPWPPPTSSAHMLLPRKLFGRFASHKSMGDVSKELEAALDAVGYAEKSYFAVPHGFALVTRLEQIDDLGAPLGEGRRWLAEAKRIQVFSLNDYIKALFQANKGRFRIIVFVVTQADFKGGEQEVGRKRAMQWLDAGDSRLPTYISSQPFHDGVQCAALIYEFEKAADDKDGFLVRPGKNSGEDHLRRTNLVSR